MLPAAGRQLWSWVSQLRPPTFFPHFVAFLCRSYRVSPPCNAFHRLARYCCWESQRMAMTDPATTLRDIRRARGLTVEALAMLVGRDKSTISRVERGLVQPTPVTIVALARALGMSAGRV